MARNARPTSHPAHQSTRAAARARSPSHAHDEAAPATGARAHATHADPHSPPHAEAAPATGAHAHAPHAHSQLIVSRPQGPAPGPSASLTPGTTTSGLTLGGGGAGGGTGGGVTGGGAAGALGAPTPAVSALVRQRVLSTVDPLGAAASSLPLTTTRVAAVSNLFLGIQQVRDTVLELQNIFATPTLPTLLVGSLMQPAGAPGASLQVSFDPTSLGGSGAVVTALTDASGTYQLSVPASVPMASGSTLTLQVHGANGYASVTIPTAQIAANGLLGAATLSENLYPLPQSILAALLALVPPPPSNSQPPPLTNPAQLPVVTMGEDGNNLLTYGANNSVDRFPYQVFFRLVEPRASIVSQANSFQIGNSFTYLPVFATDQAIISSFALAQPTTPQPNRIATRPTPPRARSANGLMLAPTAPPANPSPEPGVVTYVDRVPVEQPLSIDGFREQLMGLQSDGTFTGDETLPMAGTLGLGYVLDMSQRWTFQGLALGDLVYSLPLAPGEQQQVAIFERTDTSTVAETETLSEEEAQQQSALADTSTQATFNSAFQEAINGSSSFQTQSDSSSWGSSCLFVSGGAGSSSSSGVSNQSLQGQRDTTQQASQLTHSAAENQAAARRSAARTGMRVATASEAQSITTTTITNHNHTRALTMQYWEVQRLYNVTAAIDGLQLCCLVPLQVVRFMPPGQTLTISDPTAIQAAARPGIMARYANIIKHADVLAQALPRKFQYGMTLLQQFASDPTAGVDTGGVVEDVIQFTLTGTFLFCEDIYVTVRTDRGTRVGPVRFTNPAQQIPSDTFASQDQVMNWLIQERQPGSPGSPVALNAAMALPPSMNRSNVVGFELSRNFRTVSYMLLSPEMAALQEMNALFGGGTWVQQAIQSTIGQNSSATVRTTITLTPSALEAALAGPLLYQFTAGIEELQGDGTLTTVANEQYANDSLGAVQLPAEPYPVPAIRLGPVLRYQQLLEIEKMAQHLVRNTVQYSRAIWASLSPDERAILLEAYTIGVPSDGIQDASQMVPLLNCVENRVIGYFGNSMIMPFTMPDVLARSGANGQSSADSGQIEAALLAYHQASFSPPQSIIALPTRGVLGEGVLGNSPSAEKIDLTRFWNWQDSPSDTAPSISPVSLPTGSPSLTAGLTAPNSLGQLPSLINNVLTAPPPNTSLLQALGQNAASQQDFSSSLTGATQLAALQQNSQNLANAARADALSANQQLNSQAMATVGNIVGAYFGNPNAGSSAASATQRSGSSAAGGSAAGGSAVGGGSAAGTGSAAGAKGGPGGASGQTGGAGGTQGGAGGTQGGAGGTQGGAGGTQGGAGGTQGGPSPGPGPGGPGGPAPGS